MAKNNDVFTIIPVQNNNAVIGVGQQKSALAVNQVGIFDYDTGLSIDVAGAGSTRNFFIAMAVDRSGDGNVDDYVETAGTHIQKKNVTSYNTRCYTPGQSQIIDIVNFTANCDTQYALKIELNNDQKYMNFGYNQLTKTFAVKTACCEGCEGCPSGDCVNLAELLINEINADSDALIVASAIANTGSITIDNAATADADVTVTIGTDVFTVPVLNGDTVSVVATKVADIINASSVYTATATGAVVSVSLVDNTSSDTPVTIVYTTGTSGTDATVVAIATTVITDLAAFALANPGACPGIRLTSQSAAMKTYCNINSMYYHIRSTDMKVSFAQANNTALGFDCNGTIVITQDAVYPEGMGYDMANIEYKAGGFTGNPGPYRVGTMKGFEFDGFSNLVDKTGIYNKIDITYDLESSSGWLDYKNNLNTSIVYPCGNDVVGASMSAILDALMTDFDAKANDLAACDCDLNLTTDKAVNVDGLG